MNSVFIYFLYSVVQVTFNTVISDCYKRMRCHSTVLYKAIIVIIREYGSTLYVGLARAVSPTNTNFRLTFLLTRLQEALYKDLAV